MSKVNAKWINFDAESLTGTLELTVLLDPSGALEKSGTGITVKTSGVTNDMLAGSIGISKLAEAVILASGSQDFTANQSMGGHKLTDLSNATNANDAVTLSQLQNAVLGLDFQADVLDIQTDNTLDPGVPTEGDRYIITNSSSIHANFGTITGIGDNDIVEYTGSAFEVVYDVSTKGPGAMAWDTSAGQFAYWDGTSWGSFGGVTSVSAGDGLSKSDNTLQVVVSDFAGTGLADDGANNLRLTTQGNGIGGGAGTLLSVTPDSTTGGDVAPVIVSSNGVGVNVGNLNGDHLPIDYSPTKYTPTDSPAEAADVDDLAAHLAGIDDALANVPNTLKEEMIEVTSSMVTNGYFTLSFNYSSAGAVKVTPVGGTRQANKANVGSTGVTPDFECLNSNQIHINNNGSGTGLSGDVASGDILIVNYTIS